jgi:hypothetical protein
MRYTPAGVLALEEFVGHWTDASELEHLPSLRSTFGQGHVNADLTSLSWLALPPTTVGYHTGVLRIDGKVAATRKYRWMPYGVQRACVDRDLDVETDVRFATGEPAVLWRLTVRNDSPERREVRLEQELAAMLADSEVDWGWLYGTPWNHGHYHDFFATEKLRASVLDDAPLQTHLVPDGVRRLRLGKPRIPGIQRDEDDVAMLLDTALPAHTTEDRIEPNLPGAAATVRRMATVSADGVETTLVESEVEVPTDHDDTVALIALGEGDSIVVEFRLREPRSSGVVLTHGNHPDSLQFGVAEGVPWISVGGEYLELGAALDEAWHRLSVTMSAAGVVAQLDDLEPRRTEPWWSSTRWAAAVRDGILSVDDTVTGARAHYAFDTEPTTLRLDGSRGIATWELVLEPGASQTIGVVLDLSSKHAERAASLARDFAREFRAVREWWEHTWESAFTPGNTEFSGYAPTLHADPDLERSYYMGVLEAIYVRNTHTSPIGSIYLSGGPRLGPTTTFFWDTSEWSRVWAMLDPEALRSWIVAALSSPYDRSLAFDCKNLLPIGNYYSSNDYSIFRTVENYVAVTGDQSVLDEDANGRPILEHLREMAFRPEHHRATFGAKRLMDFGDDPWTMLEAVPNYKHVVVSFNAEYVGMLRRFAALMRVRGDVAEAERAEALAGDLADAIVDQYAGEGRWIISTPDGDETVGHCLDFQAVAGNMPGDLPDEVKAEMVEFATTKLLVGDWMIALAADDPIAPFSDRPDHGASGAFAAWPANTAYGLARLGARDAAIDFLRRVHRTTGGTIWGQAMELREDGTFFVCERGVHCREVVSGASVPDAILRIVFDLDGGFSALERQRGVREADGAELRNVRAIGFDLPAPTTAIAEEPVR